MEPDVGSDVSVVIVTYNSAESISAAVDSVSTCLPGAEMLVVDNGSSDGTGRLVGEMVDVRLIHGHGNVGFGAGVNLGIEHANRGLVLVLNPDAVVLGVDGEQIRRLAAKPEVGFLACRLQEGGGKKVYLVHSEWGWRRELAWAAARWFLLPHELTLRRPQIRPRAARRWASAAACLVSRTEFQSLGGFDEKFFLYFEDYELCRRYREAGLGVAASSALDFTHRGQGSSGDQLEQIEAWALLGLVSYVGKWRGEDESVKAARAVFRVLGVIAMTARLFQYLPFVGTRARRKGESASAVRTLMLDAVTNPPTPQSYRQVRSSVEAAGVSSDSPGAPDRTNSSA